MRTLLFAAPTFSTSSLTGPYRMKIPNGNTHFGRFCLQPAPCHTSPAAGKKERENTFLKETKRRAKEKKRPLRQKREKNARVRRRYGCARSDSSCQAAPQQICELVAVAACCPRQEGDIIALAQHSSVQLRTRVMCCKAVEIFDKSNLGTVDFPRYELFPVNGLWSCSAASFSNRL